MRIKIIQSFVTAPALAFYPDDVVDLPENAAREWIEAGLAVGPVADPETAVRERTTEHALLPRNNRKHS